MSDNQILKVTHGKTRRILTDQKKPGLLKKFPRKLKSLSLTGCSSPGTACLPRVNWPNNSGSAARPPGKPCALLELSGFITIQKGGNGGAFIKDTIHATIRDLFLDAFRMHKASIEELTQARSNWNVPFCGMAVKNHDADDIAALKKTWPRPRPDWRPGGRPPRKTSTSTG